MVPIRQVVSHEKIFHSFFYRVFVNTMSDTILKGDHRKIIPSKFGPNHRRKPRVRVRSLSLKEGEKRTEIGRGVRRWVPIGQVVSDKRIFIVFP